MGSSAPEHFIELIEIITKSQQKLSEAELLSIQITQDRSLKVGLAGSTYVLINLCKSHSSLTHTEYDYEAPTTESTQY